jgi:hypothetical protein
MRFIIPSHARQLWICVVQSAQIGPQPAVWMWRQGVKRVFGTTCRIDGMGPESSAPTPMATAVSDLLTNDLELQLEEIQAPAHGRKFGSVDRRPLDPPAQVFSLFTGNSMQ